MANPNRPRNFHAPRGLTEAEMKAQGARCGCRGSDDYCVCQNVPDAITAQEWGLTPRGSIPTVYYNVLDLLQKIASPTSDPNMEVAGQTMMDYWRRTAQQFLPAVKDGHLVMDEDFGKLLQDAAVEAQSLRSLREQYRSPSANFPTMVPVPYAQDAAKMIDALIAAIRARSAEQETK